MKSDVDLNAKAGRAKVALFILGAPNRDPGHVARRFGGHAVMLLGVGSGTTHGIEAFEAQGRAGIKIGAVEVRPDVATQHRHRRALWFGATAEVCFFAWQQASNYATQHHDIFVRVISVVLLVAMLAAAWAACRVYKDRAPDESSPPPHA